jgi:2,4-dienoyl-CoA reductase (NADPH2)
METTMSAYPLLFSPVKINQMELRNRIVMPAIHLNYTPGGKTTDQLVAFYRDRAKGGAGLMIVGGAVIAANAGGPMMVSVQNDKDIEGLSRLSQAAHDHGAAIGLQLYHAGAYAHRMLIGGEAVSSSVHASNFTREEARALDLEEIPGVQDQFAAAAVRAKQAGFDMVEILGSAGYLICQFLSPKINQREDAYGGSLENRMRFGLEVVQKVRAAVGPDYCVGIRLAGNDFVPGSHTNEESQLFAGACQEAGVDLINVTGGWHETKVPQLTPELPPAGLTYLARGIKHAVKVPVCASNRIGEPGLAEDVLARGDADLICMCRPLLTDPELPNKAASGQTERIRPCVSCNQGCFDAIIQLQPVGCLMNPRAGVEATEPPQPAQKPGKVVVVGGGPAGCQAALIAAQRGHKVVLMETADRLGGQPSWYYEATEKPDFGLIGPYFSADLAAAGVDVRLNCQADVKAVAAEKPDAVVVATGSSQALVPIPGAERQGVIDAWSVLQHKARPQGKVVVIGGGAVGLETAIFVAQKGALTPEQTYYLSMYRAETPEVIDHLISTGSHQVTVLEMLPKVGQDIGRSTRWIVFGKLKRFGVDIKTKVKVLAIEAEGVRCSDENGEAVIPADTVILATGAKPNDGLAAELKAQGLNVQVAGDAAGAGSVLKSIAQGFKIGASI